MRAWFTGDFEGCLALCDRVRPHDVDMVSQLALLRARALLRIQRPDDAIKVVSDVFVAHGTLDASLTARMLLGTAYVRRGDHQHGIALLEEAQRASPNAHPTVRSEIALSIAFGYYCLRRLEDAERALDLVSSDADIVHARALEHRGWIAVARADYATATERFSGAIRRLDDCRHYDRFLEAQGIHALSILAAERLDRPTWLFVEHRSDRFDWSARGLVAPQFWVGIHSSMMYEVDGRTADALRLAGDAEQLAGSSVLRLFAQCRRAAILRGVGERFAHADIVRRMRAELDALDASAMQGDDQLVAMSVAEEVAHCGDVVGARILLKRHDAQKELSATTALANDPRLKAARSFVDGVVADASGDRQQAHHHFREAFQIFKRVGYERRALLAALRLGEITGQTYLLDYVDRTLRKISDHSPLRERARRHNPLLKDPVAAQLSRIERTVLEMVCEGKSTAEIAEARRRSTQTIRNTVSRILTAFEVADRPSLLRECLRRGIIAG
ncbi:MAG: LuxR C-terminal-related transcriptional regulator [Candidatus Eremiobacteraeota bacterium]|nr:LuxR C-terminal-related transcriptional regulator [Candidatus Eremiobacteraeota bacterium]